MAKIAARWLRFLLLLAGDIEPHPGPLLGRREPRGPMDLSVGFAAVTADRMRKCFDAFMQWLHREFPAGVEQILSQADTTAYALRAYGLHCFQTGLPRYLFVYAITSVQDRLPHFRHALTPAWL